MNHKTINIHADTYRRLQALATPLRGSERGTPDKVIRRLLDHYEEEHPPPDDDITDASAALRDERARGVHGPPLELGEVRRGDGPTTTRKKYVRVEQSAYLDALRETGGGRLDAIAEHFDVHPATARRKLDGLVHQGLLVATEGRAGESRWYEPAPADRQETP